MARARSLRVTEDLFTRYIKRFKWHRQVSPVSNCHRPSKKGCAMTRPSARSPRFLPLTRESLARENGFKRMLLDFDSLFIWEELFPFTRNVAEEYFRKYLGQYMKRLLSFFRLHSTCIFSGS